MDRIVSESSENINTTGSIQVSTEDMSQYKKLVNTISDNFQKYDGDGDMELNRFELEHSSKSESLSQDAREGASILLNNFDDAKKMALTKTDFVNDVTMEKYNKFFGNDESENTITKKDVQALNTLLNPQKLQRGLRRHRIEETNRGAIYSIIGAPILAGGLALKGMAAFGVISGVPPAAVFAVPGVVLTGIGAPLLYCGYLNLAKSGRESLDKEYEDRKRMLSSWKTLSPAER